MHQAYVAPNREAIPVFLNGRTPTTLSGVEILFREDPASAVGEDGLVLLSGAIEFNTKITPASLFGLCKPSEQWSADLIDDEKFRSTFDPDIQRGQQEKGGKQVQILNSTNLDGMVADLRNNQFDCGTLTWNLRAGEVLWVYLKDSRELLIYEGVATRPDSNHRHHAIIQVHQEYKKWVRETGSSTYMKYNPKCEYALAIHTDDFAGEASKFFKWNTKGVKAAAGKAYAVSALTNDPNRWAKIAKDLMLRSGILGERNVEIPGTSLSKNSAKMVLFYTLVRGLEQAFPSAPAEEDEREDLVQYLSDFVAELNKLLPNEIAVLSLEKRQKVRTESIADQAITWIGYFQVAAQLRGDKNWKQALAKLAAPYSIDGFTGPLFDRENPLWQAKGILVAGANGRYKVVSNRNAQQQMISTLKEIVTA